MRSQDGDQHVVLVVSKEPCKGSQGCRAALRPIIRRGSSLTLYVAERGKQPVYFDTYNGTGEATTE
jgi:hypothetical protein